MKTKYFLTTMSCGLVVLLNGVIASGTPIPVDLSAFVRTPVSAVTFDGGIARIHEDFGEDRNNPVSLNDENFFIPSEALSIRFDYELDVPSGNHEFFDFYIGVGSEPVVSFGGKGEFTSRGSVDYDLAALAGSMVPIIFDLTSDWDDSDFGSSVIIRNVEITTIPVPGSLLLLGSGLLGIAGFMKRTRKERGP